MVQRPRYVGQRPPAPRHTRAGPTSSTSARAGWGAPKKRHTAIGRRRTGPRTARVLRPVSPDKHTAPLAETTSEGARLILSGRGQAGAARAPDRVSRLHAARSRASATHLGRDRGVLDPELPPGQAGDPARAPPPAPAGWCVSTSSWLLPRRGRSRLARTSSCSVAASTHASSWITWRDATSVATRRTAEADSGAAPLLRPRLHVINPQRA